MLDPAVVFKPEDGFVWFVGTIVDMVEEEDIGFEWVLPADLGPL